MIYYDNAGIFVKPTDEGTTPARVTDGGTWPVWSPTGKQFAFTRKAGKKWTVYTRFPLGGREEKVIDLVGHTYLGRRAATHMSWSPDGLWLATAEWSQEDQPGPDRSNFATDQGEEIFDEAPRRPLLVISGLHSHRMEAKWLLFGGLLWSEVTFGSSRSTEMRPPNG